MKIKVCGLAETENMKSVASLNPDYMGFICYVPSPRCMINVNINAIRALPPSIYKTAVFVNENIYDVFSIARLFSFNAVQLHGDETPDICRTLRQQVVVIKAFGVDDDFDFETLTSYQNSVDYFLFDTKTAGYGGSGKKFDWGLLNKYQLPVPFFLSGGIGMDNLEEVKNIKHPQLYGIDLNSKFEIGLGIKDTEKLKSAFDIIRQS